MIAASDHAAFERAITPLFDLLSSDQARAFVHYQADEELQSRIAELGDKCTEGDLTDAERAEYEGYARANRFIAIMQAKARQRLGNTPSK